MCLVLQPGSTINVIHKLKGGKPLPPDLKAAQVVNEKILKDTDADRKHWFGLIKYVNILRKDAKKSVKDKNDFMTVNKKILELFADDLEIKGKNKIVKMIADYAEEAMAKRQKQIIFINIVNKHHKF